MSEKPEAVAWMVQNADGAFSLFSGRDEAYEYAQWAHGPRPVHPLYTSIAAEQPKPLTDEEALRLWAGGVPRSVIGKNKVLAFTRAIERAHNIKGDKP